MTASSIGAAKGGGYARYLEGKTLAPERGDYYLTPGGELAQAPGRWLASPETLARLGIEGAAVDGPDFIALMEGRHPSGGGWLRRAGADGSRGGGIDVTFSAPKSVSVMWALGDEAQRIEIEQAHADAVREVMRHMTETVPTIRRRYGAGVVEEPARELIAAEYLHTTARGVIDGDAPDPQLHSHVVITSAVREDGQIVAVASRPIFRSSREVGAFYRSALAHELSERGYGIAGGTGKEGRYFEIAGVPKELLEAFSARSREVARAAERFRAKWGRAPERGELRRLKLENRKAKIPVTRADLQRVWDEKAARHDFQRERQDRPADIAPRREGALEDRVEARLTEQAATFEARELRAVLLEQSAGELAPQEALAYGQSMIAERRVLPLAGGQMTTLAVRAKEQAIERRATQLARPSGRDVGERARSLAGDQLAERIGAHLSDEQTHALRLITGPERAAVLVGPAGTGKGVVIDAAARAEQLTGHATYGIAVSGSTAQRLGQDSPALAEQTLTLDALVTRVEHGRLALDAETTIFFDEAGMADTSRLDRLTATVERTGAKLVAIGDGAQLPSIGAGGMFDRLAEIAPSAELSNIRRTLDPTEQRAWADLRAGRSDRAMAHYLRRGQLHLSDDRDHAVERAVSDWARLTEKLPIEQVALISDASNVEIDRLNARAQHYRAQRGELGELEVEVPGTHYGIRAGDRVAMIEQHRQSGAERIENGARGEVLDVSELGEVVVQFDVTGHWRRLAGEDLARLRLGYASHIHRAQGATVTRTLVVTGGWQTSKEPAYVEASRARHGTTGMSAARSSAPTGRTPGGSSAWPRRWAAARHRHLRSHMRICQIRSGGQASLTRSGVMDQSATSHASRAFSAHSTVPSSDRRRSGHDDEREAHTAQRAAPGLQPAGGRGGARGLRRPLRAARQARAAGRLLGIAPPVSPQSAGAMARDQHDPAGKACSLNVSMPKDTKTRYQGVYARHRLGCAVELGRACNCSPAYWGRVWDRSCSKHRKTRMMFSITEARNAREDLQSTIRAGGVPASSAMRVAAAIEAFLSAIEAGRALNRHGRPYKPSAIRDLQGALEGYVRPALGHRRIADLRRRDIQQLVDEMTPEKSGSRVRTVVNAVRSLYAWAEDRELVDHDPAVRVRLPAMNATPRDRVATVAEMHRLLDALDPADALPYALAVYATARRAEIRHARVGDVDLDLGVIYLGADERGRKSRAAQRAVPIVKPLAVMLRRDFMRRGRPEPTALLCPGRKAGGRNSGMLSFEGLQKRVDDIWEPKDEHGNPTGGKVGDRITAHECRHTCASWLDAAGVRPVIVSRFLGHAAPARQPGAAPITQERYTHALPGEMNDALDLLDRWLVRSANASTVSPRSRRS